MRAQTHGRGAPAASHPQKPACECRRGSRRGKKDDATYSGGFIKALIAIRLEVLRINRALLDQRIQALESGAKINVVVNTAKDDPARATQVAADIEAEKAKLSDAKIKAAQYGGLVGAMAQMTVSTHENSIAMLEQQYLIAKYGLALPRPASSTAEVDCDRYPR